MTTNKLYLDDSYTIDFTGSVAETHAEPNNRIKVLLEQTYFYPTSGGQPNDTGTLGGYKVVDVIEECAKVWHILDISDENKEEACQLFTSGSTVQGHVDWERRFSHMQQHTGQHLLTALLLKYYQVDTVSVHIGQTSYVDLDNYDRFNSKHFRDFEKLMAEAVFQDIAVSVEYEDEKNGTDPSTPERTRAVPSQKQIHGRLRHIVIENIDRNGCCGTHVRRTGEIGPLLIHSIQKYKGGSRLHYSLGLRCVKAMQEHAMALNELTLLLKAPPADMATQVSQLLDKQKSDRKENEALKGQLAVLMAEKQIAATPFDEDGIRKICIEQKEIGDLEMFMSGTMKLHDDTVYVAIETAGSGPYKVFVAAAPNTKVNCSKAIKELTASHKGRGGGRPDQAQCSLGDKVPADEILKALLRTR
eukprot:Gregarina_sp_Poly_1__5037@NODE_266_length_10382_cov_507_901212_g232_i0_p5_GENE_NODE_266_length_10382_cov_507_901212_g232_i0NODE_266_length_10382_cov_507_901212_g232_i0_p5_ORF_typecomplete_len416_score55_73tRNAsynt_2c/PF01411_19/2_1e10tRNA_SAD/PF07973_14/3_5e06_NODE_266_length_10382_cov_507_901212_g232_i077398986